jgi:hypothetical protein
LTIPSGSIDTVRSSLERLRGYIEGEDFRGYDPYDALNSYIDFTRFGKWVPVLAIQLQKRNPINLRSLLGIRKDYNPKGMGLLLQAYSMLSEWEKRPEIRANMEFLFDWLISNYTRGYSGYAWGYNFDWASPAKLLKAYTPSIVVTAFVCKGIYRYYQVTGDERAVEILRSAGYFIIDDLSRTETPEGICFSYTPIMADCCYNASMLGAEVMSILYKLYGDSRYLEFAEKAVEFTLARQHGDGHWNYSLDVDSGQERKQIDFHQGFVLESLHNFIKNSGIEKPEYIEALKKGVDYYRQKQFNVNGRALWRLPKVYPTDIHNQAQGIITFSELSYLDNEYAGFALRIALWTIKNMQNQEGYFYYCRGRIYSNKISYMRWSQAWMMLALAHLNSSLEMRS